MVFQVVYHRAAAALSALAMLAGLVMGPVHLHTHGHEHAHAQHGMPHVHDHGHHHHHAHHAAEHGDEQGHSPAPCQHDEDHCAICQFLGQASLPVAVECDAAEQPCFERVAQASPQCASAQPLRLCLSRAPPERVL